jgi:5-methylcytosine-specific restriction endonuclease McrA
MATTKRKYSRTAAAKAERAVRRRLERHRKRKRESLKRKKLLLIDKLGGKCNHCGVTHTLQFDHIYGRDWEVRSVGPSTRLARYDKEIEEGMIQLLCRICNASKGDPRVRQAAFEEPF